MSDQRRIYRALYFASVIDNSLTSLYRVLNFDRYIEFLGIAIIAPCVQLKALS